MLYFAFQFFPYCSKNVPIHAVKARVHKEPMFLCTVIPLISGDDLVQLFIKHYRRQNSNGQRSVDVWLVFAGYSAACITPEHCVHGEKMEKKKW